jgi:hypothetical protein
VVSVRSIFGHPLVAAYTIRGLRQLISVPR